MYRLLLWHSTGVVWRGQRPGVFLQSGLEIGDLSADFAVRCILAAFRVPLDVSILNLRFCRILVPEREVGGRLSRGILITCSPNRQCRGRSEYGYGESVARYVNLRRIPFDVVTTVIGWRTRGSSRRPVHSPVVRLWLGRTSASESGSGYSVSGGVLSEADVEGDVVAAGRSGVPEVGQVERVAVVRDVVVLDGGRPLREGLSARQLVAADEGLRVAVGAGGRPQQRGGGARGSRAGAPLHAPAAGGGRRGRGGEHERALAGLISKCSSVFQS